MSFPSKSHTVPFPDSSPPGGKRPLQMSYNRMCVRCGLPKPPGGGKRGKRGFICRECV
jgi:hypothetical protein